MALDFLLYFAQLSMDLSSLLDVKFIPHQNTGGPLGKMLGGVINYNNAGAHEFRDRELTKLSLLRDELQEISAFDPSLLQVFRKLYKSCSLSNYYGLRLEIAVAAALIRQGVKFAKSEAPDFTIPIGDNENVYIECGSGHLTNRKTGDLRYKIRLTIRKKVKESYINRRTALFLDVTNVLHHSLGSGNYITQDDLVQIARIQIGNRCVGSILLFFHILNKESNYFGESFIRIDDARADPELISFLDQHYLGDGKEVSNYDIPSEG